MNRPWRSAASSVAGFTTPTVSLEKGVAFTSKVPRAKPATNTTLSLEVVGAEQRRLSVLPADRVVDGGEQAPGVEALVQRAPVVERGATVGVEGQRAVRDAEPARRELHPVGAEQVGGGGHRQGDVAVGPVLVGEAGPAQLSVEVGLGEHQPEGGGRVEQRGDRGDRMAHGVRRPGEVHRQVGQLHPPGFDGKGEGGGDQLRGRRSVVPAGWSEGIGLGAAWREDGPAGGPPSSSWRRAPGSG